MPFRESSQRRRRRSSRWKWKKQLCLTDSPFTFSSSPAVSLQGDQPDQGLGLQGRRRAEPGHPGLRFGLHHQRRGPHSRHERQPWLRRPILHQLSGTVRRAGEKHLHSPTDKRTDVLKAASGLGPPPPPNANSRPSHKSSADLVVVGYCVIAPNSSVKKCTTRSRRSRRLSRCATRLA